MKRRSTTRTRLAIGATAVVVVAGGVAVARRRRDEPPAAERSVLADAADRRYTCGCGATYSVSGAGRHLVIWPAEGTPADAVLEDRCPACGRPWPAEEALTAA